VARESKARRASGSGVESDRDVLRQAPGLRALRLQADLDRIAAVDPGAMAGLRAEDERCRAVPDKESAPYRAAVDGPNDVIPVTKAPRFAGVEGQDDADPTTGVDHRGSR
jgi:hypothetical protein